MKELKTHLSEDPPHLPSWLHVVSDSIAAIHTALDYWLGAIHIKNTSEMLDAHEYLHPGIGKPRYSRRLPKIQR